MSEAKPPENIFYMAVETDDRDDCEYLSKTYETKSIIGSGAFGSVYQVCNKETKNCNYVLKVISYDPENYELSGRMESKSWSFYKKEWSREVRILKKLNRCQRAFGKKFVPDIYDAWFCSAKRNKNLEKSYLYILMEKFEGNLMDFMKKYKSEKFVKVSAVLALQVLDAYLDKIHRDCNVCLNDIKLENVLYKQTGQYDYEFVFADTGKSIEEVTQRCKNYDQEQFRKTGKSVV